MLKKSQPLVIGRPGRNLEKITYGVNQLRPKITEKTEEEEDKHVAASRSKSSNPYADRLLVW